MEFGLFGDIHGNLAALLAMWQELDTAGLSDRPLLNAGDTVGYGEHPQDCICFIRSRSNIVSVRGNYDKNVALFSKRANEYREKWGESRPEKYAAIERDAKRIDETDRAWLLGLPKDAVVTLSGVRVLVTHYAPGSKEGLGDWTPNQRLEELAHSTTAEVVVCGHTHSAFVREAGGVLWVNPGTVGRSGADRAEYAVLSINDGHILNAELKSVPV